MTTYKETYDEIERLVYVNRGRISYELIDLEDKELIVGTLLEEIDLDDLADAVLINKDLADKIAAFIFYPKVGAKDLHKKLIEHIYENLRWLINPMFETALANLKAANDVNDYEEKRLDDLQRVRDIRKASGM